MSKYPVGARWEGISKYGRLGAIWFQKRDANMEIWVWASYWADASGYESDWCSSYRQCRREISGFSDGDRFKRVKED